MVAGVSVNYQFITTHTNTHRERNKTQNVHSMLSVETTPKELDSEYGQLADWPVG